MVSYFVYHSQLALQVVAKAKTKAKVQQYLLPCKRGKLIKREVGERPLLTWIFRIKNAEQHKVNSRLYGLYSEYRCDKQSHIECVKLSV